MIASAQTLPDSADAPSITHLFLKHLLPDQGLYAVAVFMPRANGRSAVRHYWTSSLAALAAEIVAADNRGDTVYYASASFQDRNRRQTSALGARSLWLDVDAGEEAQKKNPKAYADATQAYRAVEAFRRDIGLPAPTYVASGTGLHVYWPFVDTLDPQTWKRYATGLKVLCARYDLKADPSRTADIASMLRPPGTYHRKAQPRLVECGDLTGPYAIAQFEVLLSATTSSKDQLRNVDNHSIAGRAAKMFEHRSVASNHIATQCRQVARLRDERGCILEPSWHACLGVLAFCGDGDECGHEWSSGYPNYRPEETQARLDRWRSLSGATTCEHFHSLEPKICEACPHWQRINSPIALGRRDNQETDMQPGAAPTNPAGGRAAALSQSGDAELDGEIRRLSALAPALYEHERKAIADKFAIRTVVLDKLVTQARGDDADGLQGHSLQLIGDRTVARYRRWRRAAARPREGDAVLRGNGGRRRNYRRTLGATQLRFRRVYLHPTAVHHIARKALRKDNAIGHYRVPG